MPILTDYVSAGFLVGLVSIAVFRAAFQFKGKVPWCGIGKEYVGFLAGLMVFGVVNLVCSVALVAALYNAVSVGALWALLLTVAGSAGLMGGLIWVSIVRPVNRGSIK